MTSAELRLLSWSAADQEPMLRHTRLSPIIADPAVTAPEESPDSAWHMFAHTAWGIHHYVSPDGAAWQDRGVAVAHGMRPWVCRDGEDWLLLYEAYPRFALAFSWLPGRAWRSRIDMRRSRDLRSWSRPVTLLQPGLAWHTAAGLGSAVGNPCLVKAGSRWRLYYSAGLVRIPDCGFNEPAFIGVADSDASAGPYTPAEEPLLSPDPSDPWANLSRGALRVMPLEDGWAGFENGIYLDAASGHSGSAVLLLGSRDGLSWERLRERPILRPAGGGPAGPAWTRSHVYACCPVPRPSGHVYLYFNARDDWPLSRGRECIGRAAGMPGEATQ
jgi:hypothetical protein